MVADGAELRTLTGVDFDVVHAAFVEAFSDYVVPLSPTREQLLDLLTRRGWKAELSPGVFLDGRLSGFVLNGLDGETGYNSGTGVVPGARRAHRGLELMQRSVEFLRGAGARRYILEVIPENTAAYELYRRIGFETSRDLQCWSYEGEASAISERIAAPDWPALQAMWDIEPAWQNSIASIHRTPLLYSALGNQQGYAVVFPGTGDVPQLAVAHEHRRRGLGRRLLAAAAGAAGKPLRIMNVDSADRGIETFLEHCGARRTIRQTEMVAQL